MVFWNSSHSAFGADISALNTVTEDLTLNTFIFFLMATAQEQKIKNRTLIRPALTALSCEVRLLSNNLAQD